ncbi:methenyltetrahydromethanopterin cyclohydrolase [Halocatena salina]|uniref:Methenyltetrahydromethanopterin cyclohydrolase n=1 Tax=Halocatena salina TaxID=2934340 RepID=A0A8U0A245_9EURY|nr:methenyltetrahydromethanopterin cyclohydrolase [Halocatena salina]UPM42518.1 methenyltetrahydromethanopterin cyclohydrolase [Halocatena salina]
MESLNRMATELVDEALEFTDELAIDAYELESGTTVLDFGVEAIGGTEAGLLLTEIQTAGLATVSSSISEIGGTPRPVVDLSTDHPAFSLLCSQKAGWELSIGDESASDADETVYEGLGSGPARALVATEEEFRQLAYADAFDFAVLAIESDSLPTPAVAAHVATMCDTEAGQVFLPTASTASIAGSVTMAARAGELATFRAFELGYDPLDILSVSSRAPVAPVAESEERSIARTNDALVYGGQVHLTVESDAGSELFSKLVSSAPEEYGTPLETVFDEVDWAFEELPASVFAPAQVTVDVVGGPTRSFGSVNEEILVESFGL